MSAVDQIIQKWATRWLHAGYGHRTIEMMVAILRRVAWGMSDRELLAYMGYQTRKANAGGYHDLASLVLQALQSPSSELRDAIAEIRDLLSKAEANRKEVILPEPPELTSLQIHELWREEIREKRALLPPGKGKGASRSRRKRGGGRKMPRKPTLKDLANRLDVSEEMARHQAQARQKKTPPNL